MWLNTLKSYLLNSTKVALIGGLDHKLWPRGYVMTYELIIY